MHVLHVIPQIDTGGAARTALQLIRALRGEIRQSVVSLVPATTEGRNALAGIDTSLLLQPDDLAAAVERADVVLLHFWNIPATFRFLQSSLPSMRFAFWSHVSGLHAPQVITHSLASFADIVMTTSPASLSLECMDAVQRKICVPPLNDFSKLSAPVKQSFNGRVGYVGTVDFVKMHKDFVSLCSKIAPPEIAFPVWGPGQGYKTLKKQAEQLACTDRFEWNGPTDDVGQAFSSIDIFGYPLCPDTYAGADRVLAEAMWCGLPPVVFEHPSSRPFVLNGQTGLAVSSNYAYVDAIQSLIANDRLRRSMGRSAAEFIRAEYSSERIVSAISSAFADLMTMEKRHRQFNDGKQKSGASLFVESLGIHGALFRISMTSSGIDTETVDQQIAAASPVLINSGGGGLLHYRLEFGLDPYLRYWSGLVFTATGRTALALGEFEAAKRMGFSTERINAQIRRIQQTPNQAS